MKSTPVPFVSNTPDDLHCLQAAYAMIREYFEPGVHEYTADEWSIVTGYEEGKGTWASSGLLWFASNKYTVRQVTMSDYPAFIEKGSEYLLALFGKDAGEYQILHTNVPKEQELARQLLGLNVIDAREPMISDITSALDQGSLVRCAVNSCVFSGEDGYIGHAIVVSGYNENGFTIQDPGLPPIADRHVDYDTFEKAWAYPNKEAKVLDIIKKS